MVVDQFQNCKPIKNHQLRVFNTETYEYDSSYDLENTANIDNSDGTFLFCSGYKL